MTGYGEMVNQQIKIDEKYKYLFLYIYNSNGLGGEAYDVRLLPSFINYELRLRIYGVDMISNELNLIYNASSRVLHVVTAILGLKIIGIY